MGPSTHNWSEVVVYGMGTSQYSDYCTYSAVNTTLDLTVAGGAGVSKS